jgi:hypothetical protein
MKAPDTFRKLNKLAWLLVALIFASTANVYAVPVTYTLVIATGAASGTLGTVAFSNAVLTFTFEGDTANVVDFSAPVNGHEIVIGTASVAVTDALSGQFIAQATFLPAAGIFVSVDDTNEGVGFGSFGGLPGSSQFPGLPAYPYAEFGSNPSLGTFDLRSNFNSGFGFVISCVGFPGGSCTPIALPTTTGDLFVDPAGAACCATFTAQLQPMTAFSAFNATAQIGGQSPGSFSLDGRFTLGTGSNGISPLTETVTLQLGTYSVTLPPGSFKRGDDGRLVFRGLIDGVTLQIQIASLGANRHSFRAQGRGANLNGTTTPVTVVLTIGDDSGTTTAVAPHDD